MQLARFSPYGEQTHRIHFEQEFDFLAFNKNLVDMLPGKEIIIAFDPCFIPKAGKHTYGRVNMSEPNTNYFDKEICNEDLTIYTAVVYSKAFGRDIKLAIAVFFKDGREITRKLYFSTDLDQAGRQIVGKL